MPANTTPIYSKIGDIQWGAADGDGGTAGPLKTANTAKDGTGTVLTIFTADATNGGRVDRISARAVGTNVASVLRVFVNNGSANSTVANNTLITEATLPATTLSEVAALADVTISGTPFPLVLPPGYKLMVTLGTTISAGVRVTAYGGKY
jgi:hypothetical protein